MNIVIFGTGYVGLTTGTALAYLGHLVTCVDIDEKKIAALRGGSVPIFEPSLGELMKLARENLSFSTRPEEALQDADVVFLAVGTPSSANGHGQADLSAVCAAATSIGENLRDGFTVVVNKSTVPIGSGNWVESIIADAHSSEDPHRLFTVASNPEFLREGTAIRDILYPDRVVVGSANPAAQAILRELYQPILDQSFEAPLFLPRPKGMSLAPFIATDVASAELIKYASNAFLSVKISFINEIGALAERVGADVTQIALGMGLDSRIGPHFLQAGLGWGGSCFGKDSAALVATAQEYGLEMPIVTAARSINYDLREEVVRRLLGELKILKGRTIGILGLAFKPNTDDLRDAPALDIAERLIERGARVRAHDPVALPNARAKYADSGIHFCDTPEDVVLHSSAVVLATDWPQYRELPWSLLGSSLSDPVILDGRNFLGGDAMAAAGFRYIGLGCQPRDGRPLQRGYVA